MTNREIYDNAYEMYRNTDYCMMWDYLREQVNNGNINYGEAGDIAELVVSLYDSIGDTDRPELADLAEIAIQEDWSDDEFYNTAIDMGYTPMDFDDCVTATLQMREHGLGYGDGYDFVNDLHQKYGLLEAFRMGNEYLEMQKYTEDEDEIEFCEEVKQALWELDNNIFEDPDEDLHDPQFVLDLALEMIYQTEEKLERVFDMGDEDERYEVIDCLFTALAKKFGGVR